MSTPAVSPVHVVRAHATPISRVEIRGALSRAYTKAFGKEPTTATLDVLGAHVAHETAKGERMYNFNFGGIKGASPSGETAQYKTHEVLGGRDVQIVDGFRAYESAEDGAHDYIGLLRTRYPEALRSAEAGDPQAFAAALKSKRYFTADVTTYASAIERLAREEGGSVGPSTGGRAVASVRQGSLDGTTPPTTSELERVIDAVNAVTFSSMGRPRRSRSENEEP